MVKKSIADEIKKRLKNGIPVADSAGGISGDDDNAFPREVWMRTDTLPQDDVFPDYSRNTNGISISIPKLFEKIVFDDNDFNKDLSKLSTLGEKKLEEFMDGIEKKYGFLVQVKIDIADADAQRKRKKARAVFDKFSFVRYTLSGVAITPRRIIAMQIVSDLNKEYKFLDEGI